ncbi:MAG: sugar kinase [Microbacterium sp.]|uniref:ROK family protein n=1 Tax=unclassified Microbacterium TaxID=2609290 RepID=UPI000C6238B4|nr:MULTISPECIES: ROK family protein [unclassified Microbacterium]MAY50108.1 sugar kinase [Microbacterium sp.]HBR88552.1 sugar kinase [Microbacterium sp.]HBS74901.1 sugar kinase [Microbacterium sp.]|tara:strand:- start:84949 stop:85872 length:924 start_codon:yes stop_codon:yes gene_type:complete
MRVGLDVGGTKTDAVVVDDDARVLARTRLATGWGVDAVGATIVRAVDLVAAEAGVGRDEIRSVGIGMPGQVAPGSTRVVHAVNLGVHDLDVSSTVEPMLGLPVRVENDVKAAALGAHALHGAGTGTMAYLNLGTGVAAGIVVDGQLWRGAGGSAGEVGHISVDPAGPPCRCGQRGCIEALAGGGAVAERWGRPGALPVRDVFDAADAGDPRAVALRADLARGVASAIRVLVLTADVDTVVIGGGLSALGERLTGPVADELDAGAAASAFIRSLHLRDRATLLPPASPAAALGAALVGRASEEVLAHG